MTRIIIIIIILGERVPCVCRGKLDSAETEQPRAITVDLGEAFWTCVLLLTKAFRHVSSRTRRWL